MPRYRPDTSETYSSVQESAGEVNLSNIEVKETDNGRWGLFINGILIGDSKARFDADHAKQIILQQLVRDKEQV